MIDYNIWLFWTLATLNTPKEFLNVTNMEAYLHRFWFN